METLIYILKALGIIVLILILVRILFALITEPFRQMKKKKALKQLSDDFCKMLLEEIEKEETEETQEKPKRKYTKKNTKKEEK